MLKKVLAMGMSAFMCLALCSCGNSEGNIIDKQIETVVVKETVYVTEANENNEQSSNVYYYDETSSPEQYEEETRASKKGYTTADILRKAAEAADKQYWVVFYAGYNNNRIEMASFNALENFSVKWNEKLYCEKLVGECTQFKFDDDKNSFVEYNHNIYLTGKATDIIGSNCDIYDEKNDTTINAKTE